ncbi:MAG: hypothetical protein K8I60_14390, partial [Anaerolineae bacterium]|nr:hypothetical protein [Anaerolineae bacterium]
LQKGLRWAGEAPAANVATRYALTGIACVYAHDGQPERALELLGLAIRHPLSPEWWGEREPLVLRLLDELKNALSPEVYAEAWERGKALDLDAVVAELGET